MMVYKISRPRRRKEKEIDIYQFDIVTDGGSEIQVDSGTSDIGIVKKELKEQGIYVKTIKFARKKRGLIWV